MSVYYMYAWWPWRPEEGVSSPGTEVMGSYEAPCEYSESNPDPWEEQSLLLAPEFYNQPQIIP